MHDERGDGSSESVDEAVVLRVPHSWLARLLPVAGLASSVALAQNEVANGEIPVGVGLSVIWLLWLYSMWAVPVVEASRRGVRLNSWRWTPWSEVSRVVRVPRDGPARLLPELLLRNGKRRSLEPLNDHQVEVLARLWRRYA